MLGLPRMLVLSDTEVHGKVHTKNRILGLCHFLSPIGVALGKVCLRDLKRI